MLSNGGPKDEFIEARCGRRRVGQQVKVNPFPISAAFQPALVAGAINQNATHCLSGGGEKMPSTVIVFRLTVTDKATIGLVN